MTLTVITPIAPHHREQFRRAADSVLAQTIDTRHIARVDEYEEGPGTIRNRLLAMVATEYVTFLDADDWLEPTFAERTLAALRSGHYVYTDWLKDGEPIRVPDCPWFTGNFHLVTAVMPTAVARSAGGFDETMRGMEDTDFYLKVIAAGTCGIHLKEPLVNYRRGGPRSGYVHASGEVKRLREELDRRYGGIKMPCGGGCGGDVAEVQTAPVGARQQNDVLAMALWGGNARELGRVTGRLYPRTSYPSQVWVDPRDIKAAPHHWRVVMPDEVEAITPPKSNGHQSNGHRPDKEKSGVEALVAVLIEREYLEEAPEPGPVTIRPDFAKVARLAREAVKK